MKKLIFLTLVLSLFFYCGTKEQEVEKTMIDGVAHIMNPEKPLKGEVQLDIEKTLEINPYQHEEVGLRWFYFVRDTDGEVILFNPNNAEAQRFNSRGEYIGSLVRIGPGPGEFPKMRLFNVCFMDNQIWVTGNLKFAKYDKSGQFLFEQRLGYRPTVFVDDKTFFISERERNKEGWTKKISLVNFSRDEHKESSFDDFFQKENVGMIQQKGRSGGFSDPWGTPDIKSAYHKVNRKLYVGLNTEYKIYVKDLKGKILYVMEKPYKKVRVSLEDKKKLIPWALEREPFKWALSAYPDTLVAIRDIKTLPKGYLAVFRVSGVNTFEVDVFDKDGRFMYIMKPPEGVSLEGAKFYNFGFATTETQEDGLIFYTEYIIKNLPDIFQN